MKIPRFNDLTILNLIPNCYIKIFIQISHLKNKYLNAFNSCVSPDRK